MKRQILITLFAALGFLLPAGALAQFNSGMWEIFPAYGAPTKMIDTRDHIYVLSQKSLTELDKTTQEIRGLNTANRLNANQVQGIWYNPTDGFLFVLYVDGMIDLLFDDGRTMNIADLSSTTTDYGTINDVAFRDGKAYLALSKGIIVIDTNRGLIDSVGLFLTDGNGYARIAVTDSKVFTVFNTNGRIVAADRNSDLSSPSSFRATGNYVYRNSNTELGEIYGLEGDKILTVGTTRSDLMLGVSTVIPGAELPNCLSAPVSLGVASYQGRLNPAKGGFVGTNSAGLVYVNNKGELVGETKHGLSGFNNSSSRLTNWDLDNRDSYWYCDVNGVSQRKTDGSVALGPMRPAASSSTNVGQFVPASDGRLYFSTVRRDNSIGGQLQPDFVNGYIDVIDVKGGISPVSLSVATKYDLAVNPKNPDDIVVSHRNGVTRYNLSTKETTLYNKTNTPMATDPDSYPILAYGATFDSEGNFWMIQQHGSDQLVHVVPAADWNNGAPKSAWKTIHIGDFNRIKHGTKLRQLSIENGRYMMFTGEMAVGAIDTKGTLSNVSDDTVTYYTLRTDEDGMTLGGYQVTDFEDDKNGWVWIPYESGIVGYRDFTKLFTNSPEPMRPKVARNDGTNLADYLLDNVNCYSVSVDANNNKWIATVGSGLYRVNADGSEIIEQFTTGNSSIPSDNVLAVYADPTSNKVYVGTDQGLAIYHSFSTPAKQNFDDVYAFPNPVTPDYTGYITVTGLMKDSLVKITDAAGRVVFEAKSDGGSVVWDGADVNGSRVKSGVYFVYASSNSGGSSSGAVTKIVVVN